MPTLLAALEVMDKEPALVAILVVFSVLGALSYFGAKVFGGWLLTAAIFAILMTAWVLVGDIFDRQVGPAMLQEAGWGYVVPALVAPLVAAALAFVGYRSGKRAA